MQNANPVSTPLNKSVKLIPNTKLTIDVSYVKAIRSLMYEALGIQPDLVFAIQYLSQFTTFFRLEQWSEACVQIPERYPRWMYYF